MRLPLECVRPFPGLPCPSVALPAACSPPGSGCSCFRPSWCRRPPNPRREAFRPMSARRNAPPVTRGSTTRGAARTTIARWRRPTSAASSATSPTRTSPTPASRRASSAATVATSSAPTDRTASSPTSTIKYTFGVYPLQQYLIELPGGRLQALGVAWDARPKAEGGQRWFHLYPGREARSPATRCTGPASTRTGTTSAPTATRPTCARATTRRADTLPHDVVGDRTSRCEACHGPGSAHVAWARHARQVRRDRRHEGAHRRAATSAAAPLDDRSGDAATPRAASPRTHAREIETCARCHARARQFDDAWHPGLPLATRSASPRSTTGSITPTVRCATRSTTTGSFLQSRMHATGRDVLGLPRPAHAEAARRPATPSARSATRRDASTSPSTTTTRPARPARSASSATCRRPRT